MHAKKLNHPNTVQMTDYGTTPDGLTYIAMELLNGVTLEKEIKETGGLTPERVTKITLQILKSLAEAHAHGLVHRDLKPANIMLVEIFGEKDFVKVLDFGIARAFEDSGEEFKTRTGTVIGTPQYMAPEQLKGADVGPPVDIYAMGLIMSEMLTGVKVFDDENTNMIIVAQLSPGEAPLTEEILSGPLGRVIFDATAKELDRRYATVQEFIEGLENPGVALDKGQIEHHLTSTRSILPGERDVLRTDKGLVIGSDIIGQGRTAGMPPLTEARSKLPLILFMVLLLLGGAGAALFIVTQGGGEGGGTQANGELNVHVTPPPDTSVIVQATATAIREAGILAASVSRTANMFSVSTETTTGQIRLVLISQPSGAEILRGEEVLGTTPFNAEIPVGEVAETLTIRARNHVDAIIVVNLTENAVPETVVLDERPRERSADRTTARRDRERERTARTEEEESDVFVPETEAPVGRSISDIARDSNTAERRTGGITALGEDSSSRERETPPPDNGGLVPLPTAFEGRPDREEEAPRRPIPSLGDALQRSDPEEEELEPDGIPTL
jgi:serine/threonine-protein kinase